jgi:hypothetical protein
MTATVSPHWLTLRERADAAARSTELVERVRDHLPAGPLQVHDLGGGSGAMGRWLAPRLPGPQHWVVHDRDDDLLQLVDIPEVTVETRTGDITRLEPRDLAGASLVTASALLDLLTADELARIVEACAGLPLLIALTVVGRVALRPADPLDARIGAAFNDHQRRDGRLGPDAVESFGADAVVRPSPWRLDARDADLVAEWLRGWVAAACEQDPALTAEAGAYLERRLADSQLEVTVDHADVLVLP